MVTAVLKKEQEAKTTYPHSFRFRPRINDRLNHHSVRLKRKKISLVDEALERFFDEEDKKEAEMKELQKLIQAGRDSGSTGGIPTLEEIIALAKKRYPHNHL
jgi:predicted transcriptional regulator